MMPIRRPRVSQKHEIVQKPHFVFLRNTRPAFTCAMLCPVMINHANLGVEVVAAVRRAKSSGTGLPPVACPQSLCVAVPQKSTLIHLNPP
jgi:hypothetical protein